MGRVFALVRRELSVYFVSPLAYVILTGMLFVSGFFFYSSVVRFNTGRVPFSFELTLQVLVWIIIFICPWVTARLIAEEKNRGTLEVLMTAPVREIEVVLAKYVAAMSFLAYLLAPSLFFVLLISGHADVDWGAILTGYLGVFLAASWVVAIGIFISSLCSSQMTAGILTLLTAFALFMVSFAPQLLDEGSWLRDVLQAVNMVDYTSDFLKGIVDSRQLAFGGGMIAFFLFETVVVLGSRRWR